MHPYPQLYGADSVLGQWLRTRSVIGQVDDLLFLHGGIEPHHFELGLGNLAANALYRLSLGKPKAELKQDPMRARLYDGKTSPIWYRGYFKDAVLTKEQVDNIVARLGVWHIIVGHTSQDQIGSYRRHRHRCRQQHQEGRVWRNPVRRERAHEPWYARRRAPAAAEAAARYGLTAMYASANRLPGAGDGMPVNRHCVVWSRGMR